MTDYLKKAKQKMGTVDKVKPASAELYAPGVIAAALIDIAETLRRIEEKLNETE